MSILISSVTVPEHRQRQDLGDINELADSIARLGLIHPIVVNRDNILIAGFRRFSACRSLGWTHIDNTYTDELDPLILHLIELEENVKRKDLTWLEQHNAIIEYHRLRKEQDPEWTEEKTGKAINMTKQAINSHIITEQEMSHPDVKGADSFTTARNTAKRLRERKAADELDVFGHRRLPYTSAPIINTDFLPGHTPTMALNLILSIAIFLMVLILIHQDKIPVVIPIPLRFIIILSAIYVLISITFVLNQPTLFFGSPLHTSPKLGNSSSSSTDSNSTSTRSSGSEMINAGSPPTLSAAPAECMKQHSSAGETIGSSCG
jgi:ParB family chromosome partitioning protein